MADGIIIRGFDPTNLMGSIFHDFSSNYRLNRIGNLNFGKLG